MNTHPNLHVIFGSGPIGQAVARQLAERGATVRLINRSGRNPGIPGVEVIAADASDRQTARRLCQGAAVVYQCAQPAYYRWVEEFPALQASILEGAAAGGARLVITDNLYMYGAVAGPIHEGLPYAATTRKGRVRARMAQAALDAHRAGRLQVAIGRGSDFFGPAALGSVVGERIFPNILQGKAVSATGNPDLPHTYTYTEDFARALILLGERDEAPGRAWHVPNAETLTTRQFLTLAYELAGHPPRIGSMGRLMMALGGLFIPEARETVEMMYEFEQPFIVDSSLFTNTFGMQATPLRDALAATLAWYRQHTRR